MLCDYRESKKDSDTVTAVTRKEEAMLKKTLEISKNEAEALAHERKEMEEVRTSLCD